MYPESITQYGQRVQLLMATTKEKNKRYSDRLVMKRKHEKLYTMYICFRIHKRHFKILEINDEFFLQKKIIKKRWQG